MSGGLAVVLVALVAVCACACRGGTKGATDGAAAANVPAPVALPENAPVVVSARVVCRLAADSASAAAVHVRGVDGAPSVVADGTAYWFFGDTVVDRAGGGQDVIAASVATSHDTDGIDCVDLEFKSAQGRALPLFPRADETTAWPDGILPLDDGSLLFYMVKAIRTSPFEWHVGGVGLGRVAPQSTDGARVVEKIWDENSGFGSRVAGARSPVRMGDDVVVFLATEAGNNYAAKAPLARADDAVAYTYWDGSSWSASPADAQALWTTPPSAFPPDNGVSVRFDNRAGRWMALYDANLATVQVRFANQPWGPWSEPVTWLDCRTLVGDVYPYCYSAELHDELSTDPNVRYLTFSGQQPYDVTLVELHFGVPVHRWRDERGVERYAVSSPGVPYADAGVAFYASDRALPSFSAIYEHATPDGYVYDPEPEVGSDTPVFYAATSSCVGAVHERPVYRWKRVGIEALDAGARDGWSRGDVAFYEPWTDWRLGDTPC